MTKKEHTTDIITTSTSSTLNLEVLESTQLSEQQLADLTKLYESNTHDFQHGKLAKGSIISIDPGGLVVDIGYKSNGVIPLNEFSSVELKKMVPGNQLEVVIEQLEDEHGTVHISYQKAKALKAWERIAEFANDDQPVTGVVTHKVKGGLSVDIGIPAFLPGSQVDIHRVSDFDTYIGKEITAKILKINKRRNNVIISRRKYLEEQRLEERKTALETLQENQVVEGMVKNITNYGVFVDIGGIDGLLHITDMSWGRIGHPSELVRIGDTITVKILSFDKEHEKISLGLKQLTENPWDTIEDKYAVNSKINGRISSITDYGLFVEVEKGIEGLIHISEISWTDRITNLGKHFNVGDRVDAVIVALDKDNRRMSLSVKQLKEDPWKSVIGKYKAGEKISGKITNITDFGLFVQLDEGVDGLVHISDLSWTEHVTHPGERYKKGDTVDALILSIDPDNRKISLGIKQLEKDPWETVEQQYPIGTMVEGVVLKLTNFGAFVRLPNGIEGLVHISEIGPKEGDKALAVEQQLSFRVAKINKEERKLGLSLKQTPETPPVASIGAATSPQEPANNKEEPKKRPPSTEPKKSKSSATQGSSSSLGSPLAQALAEHAAKLKQQEEAATEVEQNSSEKK